MYPPRLRWKVYKEVFKAALRAGRVWPKEQDVAVVSRRLYLVLDRLDHLLALKGIASPRDKERTIQ